MWICCLSLKVQSSHSTDTPHLFYQCLYKFLMLMGFPIKKTNKERRGDNITFQHYKLRACWHFRKLEKVQFSVSRVTKKKPYGISWDSLIWPSNFDGKSFMEFLGVSFVFSKMLVLSSSIISFMEWPLKCSQKALEHFHKHLFLNISGRCNIFDSNSDSRMRITKVYLYQLVSCRFSKDKLVTREQLRITSASPFVIFEQKIPFYQNVIRYI